MRLLKLRFRDVPVGQICLVIDLAVAVLTGLVFGDVTRCLYIGLTVFLSTKVMDLVIYHFDDSKVALVITKEYRAVARAVGERLGRGVTFLHGQGAWSGNETEVVFTAVKRQQLTELKELVNESDPGAFIIGQDAHQVLGDGVARYGQTL